MRFLSNILLVCAVMAGCATTPGPAVKLLPPSSLYQPCPEPEPTVATNGEMAVYLQDLKASLRYCNRQLEALKSWAEGG